MSKLEGKAIPSKLKPNCGIVGTTVKKGEKYYHAYMKSNVTVVKDMGKRACLCDVYGKETTLMKCVLSIPE